MGHRAIRPTFLSVIKAKAALDTAFLATYGLMYLGGGPLIDRLGTRRGFLGIMVFWSLACASHGLAGGVGLLPRAVCSSAPARAGDFPRRPVR